MTEEQRYEGFLRLVSTHTTIEAQPCHRLSATQELVIGRDPAVCQIVLDSQLYGGVSRRHALIRPLVGPVEEPTGWQICDLESANGTFINGQPLKGCQTLIQGDTIVLSRNGPEFVLEYRPLQAGFAPQPTLPGTVVTGGTGRTEGNLTLSQLLPIMSTSGELTDKAYLLPGVVTVLAAILLFMTAARPTVFQVVLGTYLGGAGYFFIYQLCGKRKPLWLLLSCALATSLLMLPPILSGFVFVFRVLLPGNFARPESGFLVQLASFFFGAGLMEELLKAVPVLSLYMIGQQLRGYWRERVGVWEPLDGILLAAASALGFTLVETLGYYAPGLGQQIAGTAGPQAGQLASLQLLIPRMLGSVAGHMAYSGYFGYFIGLSVLRRSRRWMILAVGWLTSAMIHALWNASAGTFGPLGLAFVGVLSYVFLTAAILKARELSPGRRQNLANQRLG